MELIFTGSGSALFQRLGMFSNIHMLDVWSRNYLQVFYLSCIIKQEAYGKNRDRMGLWHENL